MSHWPRLRIGRLAGLAVVCMFVALSAPPAFAGTASVNYGGAGPYWSLGFAAQAGETNQVVISYPGTPSQLTVTDNGAPLTAGTGCSTVTSNQVSCTQPMAGGTPSLDISLGDMNDSFANTYEAFFWGGTIDAGDGNDTVATHYVVGGTTIH